MVYFSLGSGSGRDVQYLFAEDVLGNGRARLPRRAKSYRSFKAEFDRLNGERVAAFQEFRADVASGACSGHEHSVTIPEGEFEAFLREAESS